MKEERRWQNRVELSLDNRQVFLLFFASAVVISLVFGLGVVVGQRLEPQPAVAAVADPLAMLDQMGQDASDDELTFHETLSKGKRLIPLVPQEAPGQKEPTSPPKATDEPASVKRAPVAPAIAPLPTVPAKKPAGAAPPQEPSSSESRLAALGGKDKAPKQSKLAADKEAAGSEAASEGDGSGGYTLQLSSFQERSEAETFVAKLQAAGLKPHMVPANIPGRGMWYRVRLGSFSNWDTALAAKERFERTNEIIAYVMRK